MFKYLLELKASENLSSLNIFALNCVLLKWKLWLKLVILCQIWSCSWTQALRISLNCLSIIVVCRRFLRVCYCYMFFLTVSSLTRTFQPYKFLCEFCARQTHDTAMWSVLSKRSWNTWWGELQGGHMLLTLPVNTNTGQLEIFKIKF